MPVLRVLGRRPCLPNVHSHSTHAAAAANCGYPPGDALNCQLLRPAAGVVAAFLVGCGVFLGAGYSAFQLAPAAEPAASLGGRVLAGLWFLPRVLFWRPTWGVAALFALSGGEQLVE